MPGKKTHNLIRYAIYTRQSSDGLLDFSSCDAQFQTCRDFAQQSGGPNLHWIGQHFDDEGYSGATLDRPAMRKLRKVIDLGGIDRVYAVALDRLTRNMRDAAVLLDEFEKSGVELRLVHQSELTSGPESRFLKHILAAFSEFERDMIATRIAESRKYLKKHGRRLAGPAPFGYDAEPATKQLVPNPSEARRVRAIFRHAANGQRPAEIARRIDHLGWRTKQWIAQRSGEITGGGRWTARQVASLLRNPVYLGWFADGKETRPGCHDAIVTPELFEAARQQLDQRRTTGTTTRREHDFPLRGKIICPKCKRPLSTYVITKKRGEKGQYIPRYYRCRSSAAGRPPCKGVSYPAWEIENFVRQQLADEATWLELPSIAASIPTTKSMATIWQSLDEQAQAAVLPQVVEQVDFGRKNSVMRIIFTNRLAEIVTNC